MELKPEEVELLHTYWCAQPGARKTALFMLKQSAAYVKQRKKQEQTKLQLDIKANVCETKAL